VTDPPQELRVRRTRRTLCVLDAIAELGERGFGPSNREIADAVGISELKAHPHQMSRILWCLETLGLIENTVSGQVNGRPNAWRLTAKGDEVRQSG
jgi:predicted ArsR family transcriptional regulator